MNKTIVEVLKVAAETREREMREFREMGIFKFEVKNSKIESASVELVDGQLVCCVSFSYEWGGCVWTMLLTNPTDVKRLAKVFTFAGAAEMNDLKEKVVRLAFCNDYLCGIGDPIKDKFIQFTGDDLEEITLKQLEALQK